MTVRPSGLGPQALVSIRPGTVTQAVSLAALAPRKAVAGLTRFASNDRTTTVRQPVIWICGPQPFPPILLSSVLSSVRDHDDMTQAPLTQASAWINASVGLSLPRR